MPIRLFITLFAILLAALPASASEDEPFDRWLHAITLFQSGRHLAEQKLWPLAKANYSTSLELFERLARDHPDYQPDLVIFRTDDLKNRIAEAAESMEEGDHDIAMQYIDFLEISNQGEELRYDRQYVEAYPLLVRSRSLIDDLVRIRPDRFGPALEKQREYLGQMIDRIRNEILGRTNGARLLNEIEKTHYLAGAITLLELPEDPEHAVSAALFPGGL